MNATDLVTGLFDTMLNRLIDSKISGEVDRRRLFELSQEYERAEQQIRALEMQVMRENEK